MHIYVCIYIYMYIPEHIENLGKKDPFMVTSLFES
jgi:hypothetical protein